MHEPLKQSPLWLRLAGVFRVQQPVGFAGPSLETGQISRGSRKWLHYQPLRCSVQCIQRKKKERETGNDKGKIRRGQGDGSRKHEVEVGMARHGMGQGRVGQLITAVGEVGGWCHVFFLFSSTPRVCFIIIQTRYQTTRHCTTQQLHNTTFSRSSHLLLVICISIDLFHCSIFQYLAGIMIHGASAHPFALPFCLPSYETLTTTKRTTTTTITRRCL